MKKLLGRLERWLRNFVRYEIPYFLFRYWNWKKIVLVIEHKKSRRIFYAKLLGKKDTLPEYPVWANSTPTSPEEAQKWADEYNNGKD